MTYRVIDSDNYAASGIETLFFPGGEPHAKVPLFKEDVLFFLKARTWNDVGIGACVWDALVRQTRISVTLFTPYFPAARQDRSQGDSPLTKNLLGYLFCAQGMSDTDVNVFDLHSDLGEDFGFDNWMPSDLGVYIKDDVVGIIAPDAGAEYRARDFLDAFYPDAHLLRCAKKRNPITGQLSDYECPEPLKKGRYIIVDDICDGGGTFNLLADAFFKTKLGAKSRLEMFVSHGIFSKGLDALDQRIENITTTDSWCKWPSEDIKYRWTTASGRLTVLPLAPLFDKIMGEI